MIKWVTAALGLVVSMAVGAGLAAAHDKAEKPSVIGETIDERDDAELEGTLEILHEDRDDGSGVYRHFLSTPDGKRLSLEGVQHPDLLTGDLVRVRGVRSGQKLQLQTKTAEALQVLQFAPLSNTFGPQKTIVLLVNFADDPSHQPFTTSAMQDYVNDQVSPFFAARTRTGRPRWWPMSLVGTRCPLSTSGARPTRFRSMRIRRPPQRASTSRRMPGACTSSPNLVRVERAGHIGGNPSTTWINGT